MTYDGKMMRLDSGKKVQLAWKKATKENFEFTLAIPPTHVIDFVAFWTCLNV